MIRARDVNLPPPTYYSYPIYDSTGNALPNQLYNVESFATWHTSQSISCPYPPCINPVNRPVAQLGAVDQFESVASSVYHGMTVSLHKRMSGGSISGWRIPWAHSIDDGQNALVTGAGTVQNSYATKSERGPSVTSGNVSRFRRLRTEGGQKILAAMLNHWKISGIMTYGSGRPVNATVSGDPNQDGNTSNDRLPKYGRNAFLGPDYASVDLRVGRKINLGGRYHLDLNAESFNPLNRNNLRCTD